MFCSSNYVPWHFSGSYMANGLSRHGKTLSKTVACCEGAEHCQLHVVLQGLQVI